jgi:hypothetical protein
VIFIVDLAKSGQLDIEDGSFALNALDCDLSSHFFYQLLAY